jgi:hypothetical protein
MISTWKCIICSTRNIKITFIQQKISDVLIYLLHLSTRVHKKVPRMVAMKSLKVFTLLPAAVFLHPPPQPVTTSMAYATTWKVAGLSPG